MTGDIRTLVVEDYPDLRDIIRLRLTITNGFTVVGTARNGREAIARAAESQPDLVLLDVMMPVMDGKQALPKIREVAPTATVVYLSVLDDWAIEGNDPDRPLADAVISKERFMSHPVDVVAELVMLVEGRRP